MPNDQIRYCGECGGTNVNHAPIRKRMTVKVSVGHWDEYQTHTFLLVCPKGLEDEAA